MMRSLKFHCLHKAFLRTVAEMAEDGRRGSFPGRTFTTKLTRRFADLIFQSTYIYIYKCMSYKSQVIKYKLCFKSQVIKYKLCFKSQVKKHKLCLKSQVIKHKLCLKSQVIKYKL